jgi:hypothetical protein
MAGYNNTAYKLADDADPVVSLLSIALLATFAKPMLTLTLTKTQPFLPLTDVLIVIACVPNSLTKFGGKFFKRRALEKGAVEAMKGMKEEDDTRKVEDESNILGEAYTYGENIEDKDVEQEDIEGLRNAEGAYLVNVCFFSKKYTIEQNLTLNLRTDSAQFDNNDSQNDASQDAEWR